MARSLGRRVRRWPVRPSDPPTGSSRFLRSDRTSRASFVAPSSAAACGRGSRTSAPTGSGRTDRCRATSRRGRGTGGVWPRPTWRPRSGSAGATRGRTPTDRTRCSTRRAPVTHGARSFACPGAPARRPAGIRRRTYQHWRPGGRRTARSRCSNTYAGGRAGRGPRRRRMPSRRRGPADAGPWSPRVPPARPDRSSPPPRRPGRPSPPRAWPPRRCG